MTNKVDIKKQKAMKFINAYMELEPNVQKKVENILYKDIEQENLNNYKGFLICMIKGIDNIDSIKKIYELIMKYFIYN